MKIPQYYKQGSALSDTQGRTLIYRPIVDFPESNSCSSQPCKIPEPSGKLWVILIDVVLSGSPNDLVNFVSAHVPKIARYKPLIAFDTDCPLPFHKPRVI